MNYILKPEETSIYGLDEGAGGELLPDVQQALERLRARAADEGIDLALASGYRSFGRQLSIWNRKVSGELPVLDDRGQKLDMEKLSDRDKVFAILRWSALPGASRHHWGTDCDVYDRAAMVAHEPLQLTCEEAYGKFATLHRWLDQRIQQGKAEGFFRPYDRDRGGIAPEPWHLSYAPLAETCQRTFCLQQLGELLAQTDIALKEIILAHLEEIHRRFIQVPIIRPMITSE